MYVHTTKKMCFIAHPRTASVATSQTLLGLGFEKMMSHHEFNIKLLNSSWTVFSTVRNPFDLLVSWYWNKKRDRPFQDWLPIFLQTSNQYLDQGLFFGYLYSTRILRYETLQDNFNQVMVESGFPPTTIIRANVSERPAQPLREYYDYKLVNLMFAHFNYEIHEHHYGAP